MSLREKQIFFSRFQRVGRNGNSEQQCEDSLVEFAKAKGQDWRKLAEDRVLWSSLEADYVAFKNQDS